MSWFPFPTNHGVKKEIVSIKNKIKSINIINFNRKSDVHIVQGADICRISYEGESYEVY